MRTALERYYDSLGNVVLRDSNGNPSIFVEHRKVNSSILNSILPDRPHPAFMCGEGVYDDAILIGKYPGSLLEDGGQTIYSLPNAIPVTGAAIDTLRPKVVAFGSNVTPITAADYGFLALLADKLGWSGKGNTYYSVDYFDIAAHRFWKSGQVFSTVGYTYVFEGCVYELLVPHTSSDEIRPDTAPYYWRKLKKYSGTAGVHDYVNGYARMLTGSGPLSWYFGNDMSGEADLIGGGFVTMDLRTVSGELQLIPYNQMADPAFNANDESKWRAILPHQSDDGCDFVAPGTEGTIKLAKINNKMVYVARELESDEYATTSVYLPITDTLVDADTIPVTPALLYEYALAPMPNTNLRGVLGIRTKLNTTYYLCHGGRMNQYSGEIQDLAKYTDVANRNDASGSTRPRARIPAQG